MVNYRRPSQRTLRNQFGKVSPLGSGASNNYKTIKPGHEFATEDDFSEWFNKLCGHFLPNDRCHFHVENERECTPQQGARRKRKGVKAGVADWIFLNQTTVIELKQPGKPLSKKQVEFRDSLSLSWGYFVAESKFDAMTALHSMLPSVSVEDMERWDMDGRKKATSEYTGNIPHITETKGK